jgi:hypothetical protein
MTIRQNGVSMQGFRICSLVNQQIVAIIGKIALKIAQMDTTS